MGLDISAYQGIRKIKPPENDESFDGFFQAWLNPDFPGRADEITHKAYYDFQDCYSFRAGSYIGYGHWRERLAEIAGYRKTEYTGFMGETKMLHTAGAWAATEGPFWELINFSDCEGVLGQSVCRKLRDDFEKFEDRVLPLVLVGDMFLESYRRWKTAFTFGADHGCVVFQ